MPGKENIVKCLDKYRNIYDMLDLLNKLLIKYVNSVLNLVVRVNLKDFRLQPCMFLYTFKTGKHTEFYLSSVSLKANGRKR